MGNTNHYNSAHHNWDGTKHNNGIGRLLLHLL